MKANPNTIRELYESGMSQCQIAARLCCSRSLIDKIMRSNGIQARDFTSACRNRVVVEESTRQAAIDEYLAGIPLPTILDTYGLSKKVFRRILGPLGRTISESNRMITQRRKHFLNQSQLDLIYGTLLGDASLSIDGRSIAYSTSHCDRQFGYINHIRECIGHGSVLSIIQKSGFSSGSMVHLYKYRNKGALQDIYDVVMVNGKKTVSTKWVNKLTPASIAYWFMDDGSSVWVGVKKNYVRISFATYSFSQEEVELLCGKLRDMGLRAVFDCSRSPRHGVGLSIRLSQSDSDKFIHMVSPTVRKIDCMTYKLKHPVYRPDSLLCME